MIINSRSRMSNLLFSIGTASDERVLDQLDALADHNAARALALLDEAAEKRAFDFYGKTFGGATEMRPLWRRVLNVLNAMMDEAVVR